MFSRNAVLGDGRAAERLVKDYVSAGGSHGDRNRIGQFVYALENSASGVIFEQ